MSGRTAMTRTSWAANLIASLLITACDSDHSGFPADHCVQDCVTGDETLVVEPGQSLLLVDSERQLKATLVATDGSQQDVTAVVSWASNAPQVAAVAGGEVTGVAPGTAMVTASLATLRAQADVHVTNLAVQQVVVSPAYSRLLPGLSQQYMATAVLSDGSTVDITRQVTWSVGNAAVAQIDARGLARAVAEGVTSVDARYMRGKIGRASCREGVWTAEGGRGEHEKR